MRFLRSRDWGTMKSALPRVALAALVTASSASAWGSGFSITEASTAVINDIYTIAAQASYEFSEESLEALANAVSLTISVEVEFKRKRKYLWDPVVARAVQGYRLERHALSEQYLVINATLDTHRSFKSLEAAITSLGVLDPIPVAEVSALDSNLDYVALIRSRLDIEALPGPMRPIAYISPNWRLSSGWYAVALSQ